MTLPMSGWSTHMRTAWPTVVRNPFEAAIDPDGRPIAPEVRPDPPAASDIDDMDEAMAWIGLIPAERYVLRRIVGARALIHPVSERHIWSWRGLGRALGADHRAVQRWHEQAIDLLVAALRARVSPRVAQ